MRLPLYSLLASLLLPACARHAVPAAHNTGIVPPGYPTRPRTVSTIPINTAPGDTVLVFERTPCHGTCPTYTATVFRNGRVSYVAGRFVPVTGQQTLSLPPATVQALLDDARRLNFNSLQPDYGNGGATDLPTCIVTVWQPGQPRHRVQAERQAAPPALQTYLDHLGATLDPLAGIKAEKN